MNRHNMNSNSSYGAPNIKGQAKNLREAMAAKRRGDNGKVIYLIVTRVGSRASGNAMKYGKLTAQMTAPTTDLSLQGIKEACASHFKEKADTCVLLLSDKGAQVLDVSQLNIKKPYFCSFTV